MTAALDDADRGHQRELCVTLQVGKICNATVAHCGFYLVNTLFEVIVQRTCIGDIGVHALLKAELGLAAEVVSLPVAGTV